MIKVKVENIVNGKKFESIFEFQNQVDAWIQEQTLAKSWGQTPDDYTVEQEDISAQINLQKEFAKVRIDQEHGLGVKTEISALLRSKLFDGDITIQELAAII
jgi:hypothetical protein